MATTPDEREAAAFQRWCDRRREANALNGELLDRGLVGVSVTAGHGDVASWSVSVDRLGRRQVDRVIEAVERVLREMENERR